MKLTYTSARHALSPRSSTRSSAGSDRESSARARDSVTIEDAKTLAGLLLYLRER